MPRRFGLARIEPLWVSQVGKYYFLRQVFSKRAGTLGALSLLTAVFAACSSGDAEEPQFDSSAFTEINPEPEIRAFDYSVDTGFNYVDYERDRIPRDAISPIYSPKFVLSDESVLEPGEMVMGLAINGDARAYPVVMLRIREMVNDEVGGTPVLVTW